MTLIDKAEALAILAPAPNSKGGLWATRKQALYEQVAALPARDVGVPADVRDYAIEVSEAYDTMMEVQRNPAGAWQVIQALAGHIAALAPTDAAQDDDPECTDCGGTGITYQTERVCACQPTDAAQAREAALREAAEVCTYVIKNMAILKADGETYETPRVQKIARGLVDIARQDILALIDGEDRT